MTIPDVPEEHLTPIPERAEQVANEDPWWHSDWTREINYFVSYRFCEPGDPLYDQREVVRIKGTGGPAWKAAQELVERLARPYMLRATADSPLVPTKIQDEIEIYAQTVLRSPRKHIVMTDVSS